MQRKVNLGEESPAERRGEQPRGGSQCSKEKDEAPSSPAEPAEVEEPPDHHPPPIPLQTSAGSDPQRAPNPLPAPSPSQALLLTAGHAAQGHPHPDEEHPGLHRPAGAEQGAWEHPGETSWKCGCCSALPAICGAPGAEGGARCHRGARGQAAPRLWQSSLGARPNYRLPGMGGGLVNPAPCVAPLLAPEFPPPGSDRGAKGKLLGRGLPACPQPPRPHGSVPQLGATLAPGAKSPPAPLAPFYPRLIAGVTTSCAAPSTAQHHSCLWGSAPSPSRKISQISQSPSFWGPVGCPQASPFQESDGTSGTHWCAPQGAPRLLLFASFASRMAPGVSQGASPRA